MLPDWTELEELGFRAFPAMTEERRGPLVCRASGGFSYRNSSVTLTRAPEDWPATLAQVQAFCAAHGIAQVLRIPGPIAPPDGVPGWDKFRVARVMFRPVHRLEGPPKLRDEPASWDNWLAFQHAHRGDSVENAVSFEKVMRG